MQPDNVLVRAGQRKFRFKPGGHGRPSSFVNLIICADD